MLKRTVEDRLFVLETLVEMLVRELPADQQEQLMDRLIDRATGFEGADEVAHDWDDRVMGGGSMRNRLSRRRSDDPTG